MKSSEHKLTAANIRLARIHDCQLCCIDANNATGVGFSAFIPASLPSVD